MKAKIALVVLGIFFIVATINFFKRRNESRELSRSGVFSIGKVIGTQFRAKDGNTQDVKFVFKNEDSTITSNSTIMGIFLLDFEEHFLYRNFPVIYLPRQPQICEILITPDRFRKYGLKFPDSLNWVKTYWHSDYIRSN